MRRTDGRMSQIAQNCWPGATVELDDELGWLLVRPGLEDQGLGPDLRGSYGQANVALRMLVFQEEARRRLEPKEGA